MTPLPQRKKTDEEIAKLREELGIPVAVPITTKMETEVDAAHPAVGPAHPTRMRPTKPQTTKFQKLIHADGSREPITLPGYKETVEEAPPEMRAAPAVQIVEDRDLDSLLPKRKRSALELEEMRHREMLRQLGTRPLKNIKFMPCHPAAIAVGYILAGAGSALLVAVFTAIHHFLQI